MPAKRALVVDDSKSARVFLARMLEKYELEVDSAESAEQAIEYLTHHRPDVIFMDHLMPGMDGFQAVRTIKNNPRTATIPILMYTSQEGELYVGQARALGAVGVLPKQIRPVDVSKVLYQLHLLPDRRSHEQSAFHPVSVEEDEDLEEVVLSVKPLTDAALREHLAELRRALVATLDGQASRIKAELHATLERALARDPAGGELSGRRVPWGWVAAAIAAIVAVASLYAANRESMQRAALADQVAQLSAALASAGGTGPDAAQVAPRRGASVAPPESSPAAAAESSPAESSPAESPESASPQAAQAEAIDPIVEVVPYGEDPLGGPRLDALRQLFDRLLARGYKGVVDVKIFPGRFCLTGDSTDGLTLAPDEMPYSQCSAVGAVPDDSGPQPQRVSVGFADLAATLRSASHGTADVQVESGDAKSTIVAYPPVSDSLTAGEWNRAASANNRIEIRVH